MRRPVLRQNAQERCRGIVVRTTHHQLVHGDETSRPNRLRRHSSGRDPYRENVSFGIKMHLVDTDHTMVPVRFTQRSAVIDDIPAISARRA
jgi:hypothetical protein